jgi:hypothetical protein
MNELQKLIDKKLVIIKKIRGEDKPVKTGIVTLLKRPYIEILVPYTHDIKWFNRLKTHFTVISRNYKTKQVMDNLDSVTSVPLLCKIKGKEEIMTIPKCINDPYNVKFFKPHGQYGIGIAFDIYYRPANSKIEPKIEKLEYIQLHSKDSFYDTKDLRGFGNALEFPEHASIFIFSNKIECTIPCIMQKINDLSHV